MLSPYGISFGDRVYEGEFKIGEHTAIFNSGNGIIKFPRSKNNYVLKRKLNNQGHKFLLDASNVTNSNQLKEDVAILGLYQNKKQTNSGRIAVYGDSNCLDTSHNKRGNYYFRTYNYLFK